MMRPVVTATPILAQTALRASSCESVEKKMGSALPFTELLVRGKAWKRRGEQTIPNANTYPIRKQNAERTVAYFGRVSFKR